MNKKKNKQPIFIKEKPNENRLSTIELFEKYKFRWKWFLISVLITISLAFLYLRYSDSLFSVYSTIHINDSKIGGLATEQSAFSDLGVLRGENVQGSVFNETTLLKSRTLFDTVVKDLELNIIYRIQGKVKNGELYGAELPFKLYFTKKDSLFYSNDTTIYLTWQSTDKLTFFDEKRNVVKSVSINTPIKSTFGEFVIRPKNLSELELEKLYTVKITPLNIVVDDYRKRVKIDVEALNSSIVTIRLNDAKRDKAIDFLDKLIDQYIANGIDYRKQIAENTDIFINERISDVYEDLSDVDQGVEQFKVKNKLTDINMEAGIDLSSNSAMQDRMIQLNSQLQLIEFIQTHLRDNPESLIPSNLGLRDIATNENTANYNNALLERNRIIQSSSRLNPAVKNLDAQLITLRRSIDQSLINSKSSLDFELREFKNQEYLINSKRQSAPRKRERISRH